MVAAFIDSLSSPEGAPAFRICLRVVRGALSLSDFRFLFVQELRDQYDAKDDDDDTATD